MGLQSVIGAAATAPARVSPALVRLVLVRPAFVGLAAVAALFCASCATIAKDPVAAAAEFEPGSGPGDDDSTVAKARVILDECVDPDSGLRASASRTDRARDLVESHPDSPLARTALAITLAAEALETEPPELRLWREAEAELLIAERLAPAEPEVARWHARFLTLDGHLEAAAQRLDRALTAAPDDVELLRAAIRVHFDRGAELRAIDLGERLTALGREDADLLWMLAESRLRYAGTIANTELRQRDNYERAVRAFEAYRATSPDDPDGALGEGAARYGLLLSSDDSAQDAVALVAFYEEQCARFADRVEFPFAGGLAAERAKDPMRAEAFYRNALSIEPEHTDTILNLIALLADEGRTDEARALAERMLEIDDARGEDRRLPGDERNALEAFVAPVPVEAGDDGGI